MEAIKKIGEKTCATRFLLTYAVLLLLAGCQDESFRVPEEDDEDSTKPPAALKSDELSPEQLRNLKDLDVNEAEQAFLIKKESSSNRVSGPTTYIHFGDETACTWNPYICENTFVTWPGYIQSTGYGEWGYAWMSNGPGTSFISYGTGSHYHIVGLAMPDVESNPKHSAMFGSDWFAFYMQRSGTGRINFDLTEIKVKGSVPITLWFKAANGSWWYWPNIGPGWWSLPGATNIQEFHIRAASGSSSDKYSIDDIKVRGL